MTAPFGISFYAPIDQFDVEADLGGTKYRISAPTPHPIFSSYIVQATPSLGIVWIKGLAEPFDVDAYGDGLRSQVDRIAAQLATKYGTGRKSDVLLSGATWDEPQYWMNAVEHGERFYSYVWELGKTSPPMPSEILTIYLGASVYGHCNGATVIEYASVRAADADREVEASLADLL